MAENYLILINKIEDFPEAVFEVTVSNGDQTRYTVKVAEQYYKKLTEGRLSPEELVRKSFDFLLEREPKESILKSFELPVISRYFPEYERTIVE